MAFARSFRSQVIAAMDGDWDEKDEVEGEDEFLVWEPRTSREKCYTFFANSYEAINVLIIAVFALLFPSFVSCAFLAVSFLLFSTMASDLKDRNWLGIKIQIGQLVVLVSFVIYKALAKIEPVLTDRDAFLRQYKFFEGIGIDLKIGKKQIDPAFPGPYKTTVNYTNSFVFEIALILFTLITIYRLKRRENIIAKLQKI